MQVKVPLFESEPTYNKGNDADKNNTLLWLCRVPILKTLMLPNRT